jgi:nucleotide-binding universal stress UspA family protein
MKTIICPTDFSKNAENAALYASGLADDFHAELILLHAYQSPAIHSDMPLVSITDAEGTIKSNARKKLDALIKKISRGKKIKVTSLLIEGLASDIIAETADKKNADLIIMGTTGTSKFERLLIGSTTSRVMQHAECPVLCIPGSAEFKGISKIVFATDLHEDNVGSAVRIESFARHFDAELIFVFIDDKHLAHGEDKIEQMTKKIRKKIKHIRVSGFISEDKGIARGIQNFLKKHSVDLLVMFTHRRHFPEMFFNSSITTLMSHQTKIPLLSLRMSDKTIMEE